jgi:hypothetical protein
MMTRPTLSWPPKVGIVLFSKNATYMTDAADKDNKYMLNRATN